MAIPTLQNLYDDIIAHLESALGIVAAFQKKTVSAFAQVQAGKLYTYYLSAAKVQKNIFVDTAEPESSGGTLERFGRVKLNRNPFPATQGKYQISMSGSLGAVVPAGATLRLPSNNAIYAVDTDTTFATNPQPVDITSVSAGEEFALEATNLIYTTSPIVDVNSEAEVVVVTEAPNDAEDLENYRALALQAYRTESQGGAAADYRIWAADVQGLRTVYPFAGGQAGVVNVYAESDDVTLLPTPAQLTELEEVINFDPDTSKALSERGRRPISAWEVNYLAVTPQNVDVAITGLDDSSASVIAALDAAISQFLLTVRPFVGGADDPNTVNDTLRLSQLNEVISAALAPGNFFESVEMFVSGVSVTSYKFENGEVPKLNSIIPL